MHIMSFSERAYTEVPEDLIIENGSSYFGIPNTNFDAKIGSRLMNEYLDERVYAEELGFDGVMLGHHGSDYHVEFTRKRCHKVGRAPTEDNLLIIYLPDEGDWNRAVDQMEIHGHRPVKAFNPYWDKKGKTFEDSDGYRVVLQNSSWPS